MEKDLFLKFLVMNLQTLKLNLKSVSGFKILKFWIRDAFSDCLISVPNCTNMLFLNFKNIIYLLITFNKYQRNFDAPKFRLFCR
jgi:hypothetical protein